MFWHRSEMFLQLNSFKTTGYSLGGSLASMTAVYLAKKDLVDRHLVAVRNSFFLWIHNYCLQILRYVWSHLENLVLGTLLSLEQWKSIYDFVIALWKATTSCVVCSIYYDFYEWLHNMNQDPQTALILQIASVPRSPDPSTVIGGSLFYRQPLFYRYLVHYNNKMQKDDQFVVSIWSVPLPYWRTIFNFQICGLSDDYGCRNTHKSFSMADHTSYFNLNREQFIKNGCPRDLVFWATSSSFLWFFNKLSLCRTHTKRTVE